MVKWRGRWLLFLIICACVLVCLMILSARSLVPQWTSRKAEKQATTGIRKESASRSSLERPINNAHTNHRSAQETMDSPRDSGVIEIYNGSLVLVQRRHMSSAGHGSLKAGPIQLMSQDKSVVQDWWWGHEFYDICITRDYGDLSNWPTVSIIIAFHENERLSDVIHTVHSIVQRTPPSLLKEIILIDDNTTKEDFKDMFENYLEGVFAVNFKILRSAKQLGLIKGRLYGARLAKGDVIVSMDAHLEMEIQWLEPLLVEIRKNRKTMATPSLDWMEMDKGRWHYRHGPSTWRSYFDWAFSFGFQDPTPREIEGRKGDITQPVNCPASVGTVWAMDRKFFFEIGALDEEMEGWGGENIDLPLRTWLFGGRAVNVPCSHVAHRERPGFRDYRGNEKWTKMMRRNYRRVSDVWFDKFNKYVYHFNSNFSNVDPGDLTERMALKKRAVHNMEWFVDNVFPELNIFDRNAYAWGTIKNVAAKGCVDTSPPNPIIILNCTGEPSHTTFSWTLDGELRWPVQVFNVKNEAENKYIIEVSNAMDKHKMNMSSKWIHWKNGLIMWFPVGEMKKQLCLQSPGGWWQEVTLRPCDHSNPYQRWIFQNYGAEYTKITTETHKKSFTHLSRHVYQSYLEEAVTKANRGIYDFYDHLLKTNVRSGNGKDYRPFEERPS